MLSALTGASVRSLNAGASGHQPTLEARPSSQWIPFKVPFTHEFPLFCPPGSWQDETQTPGARASRAQAAIRKQGKVKVCGLCPLSALPQPVHQPHVNRSHLGSDIW
jgi:hypothetical protein